MDGRRGRQGPRCGQRAGQRLGRDPRGVQHAHRQAWRLRASQGAGDQRHRALQPQGQRRAAVASLGQLVHWAGLQGWQDGRLVALSRRRAHPGAGQGLLGGGRRQGVAPRRARALHRVCHAAAHAQGRHARRPPPGQARHLPAVRGRARQRPHVLRAARQPVAHVLVPHALLVRGQARGEGARAGLAAGALARAPPGADRLGVERLALGRQEVGAGPRRQGAGRRRRQGSAAPRGRAGAARAAGGGRGGGRRRRRRGGRRRRHQ